MGRRGEGSAGARGAVAKVRRLLGAPAQLDQLQQQLLEARHQLLEAQQQLAATHAQLLEARHELVAEYRSLAADRDARHHEQLNAVATLSEQVAGQRALLVPLGRGVAALGEALARLEAPDPAGLGDGPVVSIVLPVRDREAVVGVAVRSVLEQTYGRWELLVVDDGSVDGSMAAVKAVVGDDERVRILAGPATGAPAARNVALRAATGDVVAYLDSDNRWLPTYLAHLAATYRDQPGTDLVLSQQLVVDDRTGEWWLRDDDRLPGDLDDGNFVDLNAFSHRRSLVDELGVFDESLRRLSDWDLARRYAADRPLHRLAVAGSVDRFGQPDQITEREPVRWYVHLVREKHRGPVVPGSGPRVLCAEWHYPQLSESYVQADIEGLKALGAHVEVWSEERSTASPYPTEEPIHHGDLRAAIDRVRPDVVVTHWLNIGAQLCGEVAATGVPMVVRGHGFEYRAETVDELLAQPNVRRVYLFPHLHRQAPVDERVRELPVAFDARRYRPVPPDAKDRALVVRVGVAIPTKAYGTFFEVARRCPDHRFVLCLATAHKREEHLGEILAEHEAVGSPVEIRVDVPHDEVAALVSGAGISLHTLTPQLPFGMPISIAEAMATGCYVIAPDLPGCAAYTGDAADRYRTPAEAGRLVAATAHWSDARWAEAARRSIDLAFGRYTDLGVAETLLRDWEAFL